VVIFFRTIKNALSLLCKGDWREFNVRARIVLGQIDLKTVSTDELNLPIERANSYSDSGGSGLQKVLSTLNITPRDAIIDFGCGKGGALITLARYPFAKITGVEISADLGDIARKNLGILTIDNVHIICCDAAGFTELDDYNYVYFFNPFPAAVMRSVIDNLKKSLAIKPRKVTIIYLNPVCNDEIISDSPFTRQEEFDHASHRFFVYSNGP
jgi:protein-L-isoaspartate O-methyltransferase